MLLVHLIERLRTLSVQSPGELAVMASSCLEWFNLVSADLPEEISYQDFREQISLMFAARKMNLQKEEEIVFQLKIAIAVSDEFAKQARRFCISHLSRAPQHPGRVERIREPQRGASC